jgi:hypothetical protein
MWRALEGMLVSEVHRLPIDGAGQIYPTRRDALEHLALIRFEDIEIAFRSFNG